MARLARGDREAFNPLYAALRPRALHVARVRAGEADAADVAQAALLRVFARASDFQPGKPCLPWFYAIVGNEIRAAGRKVARLSLDNEAAGQTFAGEHDPEAQLVARELERALELAVSDLEAESAEAIRAMLDRAPAPDVPPATFRKRVSRAYVKLRLLLGGHHGG
jgi:RNA polymerase sigma-70 factor (ECF subfamily)